MNNCHFSNITKLILILKKGYLEAFLVHGIPTARMRISKKIFLATYRLEPGIEIWQIFLKFWSNSG
jgi:hypothetical protein